MIQMSDPNSPKEQDSSADLLKKIKTQLKKEIVHDLLTEISQNQPGESSPKVAMPQDQKLSIPPPKIEQKDTEITPKVHETQVPLPVESEKLSEKIIVSMKAILKFTTHAFKYANAKIPRSKWVEVIGILAGQFDEKTNTLTIEEVYPMGHGTAIYTEIKDYKNFVRAFEDLRKEGYFICGWYHSHPSYGLFISVEDFATQARYQRLWDKSVALVVDPYLIDGKNFGFELFRANLKTKKWYSVPFSIKNSVDVKTLPEFLEFVYPLAEGKDLFLEYDE